MPNNGNLVSDQNKLDSLEAIIEIKQIKAKENSSFEAFDKTDFYPNFSEKKTATLFNFDPNTVSSEQFQSLGLPKFIAERIVKYRNAGGKFKKKEDFAKIYGLFPETYEKLAPFIQIEQTPANESFTKIENSNASSNLPVFEKKSSYVPPTAFDLNDVDTTQLIRLKGIGSKTAIRIIKFRQELGGFLSENQLTDIWGLDSLALSELQKFGSVKSPQIKKIKINSITAEAFKHPYLRPFQVKIILAYRSQHGNFANAKDLEKIKVLDQKTIEKLSPYLDFSSE